MLKKIISLTKVFIKDFYQNLNIVNKETRKVNKKSVFFWLLVILSIAFSFLSYKAIDFLVGVGEPEIFLNIYFTFLTIFLLFQIALISSNIFFFSKDLEFILPLPISSLEILIAKFLTVLTMVYMTEGIFGFLPLLMYGLLNFISFSYFIWFILALIVFPIIMVATISMLTIILMKLIGFIKNKNVLQNIINTILIMIALILENLLIRNEDFVKEGSFIIEPFVKLLSDIGFINKIVIFLEILIASLTVVSIFCFICKGIYLKGILRRSKIRGDNKRKQKKKKKIKTRNRKINRAYVAKEWKMLLRQPIFFMQTIFPVFILLITVIMIGSVFIPILDSVVQEDESIRRNLESLTFNSEMVCVILGILQCIFSISKLSLTAISREGKNASFMKYIPIDLYHQFLYKNVLQVVLNIIVSIVILGLIYYFIPKIGFINIALIFMLSIWMNLINSYLMLIVDLRRPSLNWNSEYTVVKKSDSRFFQYVLTIGLILVFMYLSTIFKEMNATILILVEVFLFMTIFIIMNYLVKKYCDKLFSKII